MIETPTAADWATARGQKWRGQLDAMEAMLAPVDAPLIEALQLDAPYKIADIGCGGGGTTLAIGRCAHGGSTVHGYDISPDLIEAAQVRTEPGEDAIAFAVADSGTTQPEAPYDRLVSRFGVMFYDDPPRSFANLATWLAPGGRFAFAVWGPPAENPWMSSLRAVMSEIVDLPAPDPDAPGPFRYAGGESLCALLEGAGLRDVAIDDWCGRLSLGGGMAPDEAARFALTAFSIGEVLDDAGADTVEAVHQALIAHYEHHHTEGAVTMNARVHIVTGAAPRSG